MLDLPLSDEIIPIAFALNNSRRRYALLVGSGISQDAGIPTASEITDDLIQQIAGKQIKRGQKPQDWYKDRHKGKEPTFASLFEEIAPSEKDRAGILNQFFEPDKKIEPTEAHLCIARLVKDGIINVIITTNFDPLLEKAITEVTKKKPVVITHNSDEQFMEVGGDHCRIVMVNGNYKETDLKLTPEDLKNYDDKLARYLNRIFEEFGLVICGWSGTHDTALVNILTANRIRRFAIFWCSRDSPEKIPIEIKSNLHLSTVGIRSANDFFSDLKSKIDLLQRYERITYLTVDSAVKAVKDALKDQKPELILSDLLNDEIDRVLTEMQREVLPGGLVISDKKGYFRNRLEDLERVSSPLAAMVATIAFYDNGNHAELISEAIDRLINFSRFPLALLRPRRDFQDKMIAIQLYPVLLVTYASGITAVRKENFNSLSAILEKPKGRRYINMALQNVPLQTIVNIGTILGSEDSWFSEIYKGKFDDIKRPFFERAPPVVELDFLYEYSFRTIEGIIKSLIPSEKTYEESFEVFEYLMSLSYLNQCMESGRLNTSYLPLTRLGDRYFRIYPRSPIFAGLGPGERKLPDSLHFYLSNIRKKIEDSDFFKGNSEQFQCCNIKFGELFQITPPETGIRLPSGS